MKSSFLATSAIACAVALASTAALGQPADPGPTPYLLTEQSHLEMGCFPPCMCPVLMTGPVAGTFKLTPNGSDPLFDYYLVTEVDCKVALAPAGIRITGGGTYKVGGEVAIQHQMVLDLSLSGGPPLRFDSGLVIGGGEFPLIDIAIARHEQFCHDTVLYVNARPALAGVTPQGGRAAIQTIRPNPFVGTVEVLFALAAPGAVDARVFDVQGHEVRVLADAEWREAGPHTLLWDGRRQDGRGCPAGLYYVQVETGGRQETRSVVKLR